MGNPVRQLRLAIEQHKWILWAILATVLVIVWFVVVALLPHHVVNTLQQSEEQVNGLREPPSSTR
jgi:preprotein translocase subunit SecY